LALAALLLTGCGSKADCIDAGLRKGEALALYETLHKRVPEDDTVANNSAYLLAETRGDAGSLKRALELTLRFASDTNAGFLDTLGWVHFRMGNRAQAVAVLERAVGLAPDAPLLQLHLGLALNRTGQTERSRDLLRKVLASKAPLPNLEEARRNAGAGAG
jgi:Flp pilus assembly protein TadD